MKISIKELAALSCLFREGRKQDLKTEFGESLPGNVRHLLEQNEFLFGVKTARLIAILRERRLYDDHAHARSDWMNKWLETSKPRSNVYKLGMASLYDQKTKGVRTRNQFHLGTVEADAFFAGYQDALIFWNTENIGE